MRELLLGLSAIHLARNFCWGVRQTSWSELFGQGCPSFAQLKLSAERKQLEHFIHQASPSASEKRSLPIFSFHSRKCLLTGLLHLLVLKLSL